MNYNKIIKYCDKYFINRYSYNGKPLTYNKLKNSTYKNTIIKECKDLFYDRDFLKNNQ